MGMFEPMNYGKDFVQGFSGMASAITGIQDAQDRRDQRQFENARQVKADDRAERTLADQLETNKVLRDTHALDLEHKQYVQDQEKTFDQLYQIRQKKALDPNYQYSDEDIRVAGKALGLTQGVPNDPAQFPRALQNMETVLQGSEMLRQVPPGGYVLRRGDLPQADTVLDAYQNLLSDKRLGGVHVDETGEITGTPGTSYKTATVGGVGVQSGQGNQAAFVPLFTIVRDDGTPIVDATGQPRLVPATVGQSNAADAPLNYLTPEKLQMMVGARVSQMRTIDDMIAANPANRDTIMAHAMEAALGHDEKVKQYKDNLALAKEQSRMDTWLADPTVQKLLSNPTYGDQAQSLVAAAKAGIAKPDVAFTQLAALSLKTAEETKNEEDARAALSVILKGRESLKGSKPFLDKLAASVTLDDNGNVTGFQDGSEFKSAQSAIKAADPIIKIAEENWRNQQTNAAHIAAARHNGTDKLPAEAQLVEYYKRVLGTTYDQAVDLVKSGKSHPEEMAVRIYTTLKKDNTDPAVTDAELRRQAAETTDFIFNRYGRGKSTSPSYVPGTGGLLPDRSMSSHGGSAVPTTGMKPSRMRPAGSASPVSGQADPAASFYR